MKMVAFFLGAIVAIAGTLATLGYCAFLGYKALRLNTDFAEGANSQQIGSFIIIGLLLFVCALGAWSIYHFYQAARISGRLVFAAFSAALRDTQNESEEGSATEFPDDGETNQRLSFYASRGEPSLGGVANTVASDDDEFSLENLLKSQAAAKGEPLTPDEIEAVKKLHADIEEAEREVAKAQARLAQHNALEKLLYDAKHNLLPTPDEEVRSELEVAGAEALARLKDRMAQRTAEGDGNGKADST